MAEFKSEPLKSWTRGKELRENYYSYYRDAHERGAIRAAGGAWAFDACLAGLEPVAWLTSEPYAASVAWNRRFAAECQEAVEAYGYPRDLCAYMRNYWGSILVNKYAFGGPFPKPDVLWQNHICCSHGKWYQTINELEGGDIPFYCVDMGVGAYPPFMELREYKMKYVADQLLDGIEWLERIVGKKFGRRYDDEQFIEAVWNDIRSTSKWAEICVLNQVVPAPLDEKTMYSLYVLATLQKSSQWCADFYAELYEDVKDRVDRGIAAVPDEKVRIITDNQPPWAFLNMFRYMERCGCVSVGSLYTFGLEGMWLHTEDGRLIPRPMPKEKPKDREEACWMLADWHMSRPAYQHFYHADYKIKMIDAICRDWKLDGVLLHYNRGCEGLSLNIAESRLGLIEKGWKVVTFEGNMGDEQEFDEASARARIDAFLEQQGVKKPGH